MPDYQDRGAISRRAYPADDWGDHRGAVVPLLALATGALVGAAALSYYRSKLDPDPPYTDDAPAQDHWGAAPDGVPVATPVVTINRPRSELYDYWHKFENLPRFMENVTALRREGDTLVWTVAAPMGREITLRTRVTEARQNERIAWESVEGSDIRTSGWVSFRDAPADRGSIVEAHIAYEPPGGELGRLAAKLFRREPAIQGRHELKRFKMLMETGEITTSQNRKTYL